MIRAIFLVLTACTATLQIDSDGTHTITYTTEFSVSGQPDIEQLDSSDTAQDQPSQAQE